MERFALLLLFCGRGIFSFHFIESMSQYPNLWYVHDLLVKVQDSDVTLFVYTSTVFSVNTQGWSHLRAQVPRESVWRKC